MKKTILIVLSVLMMALLLAGCGNKQEATPDSAERARAAVSSLPAETTKVIETTTDGGTIEQDSEGNTLERKKSGEIVSVKDKDGNTIEVTEYITTHTYVNDSPNNDGGSSGSASDGSNDNSKESSKADKKDTPKPDKDKEVEIPENKDEYELPII